MSTKLLLQKCLTHTAWTNVVFLLLILSQYSVKSSSDNQHYQPPLECNDPYGRPQRCVPEFENAAYKVLINATNTCGEEGTIEYCVQTGYANRKSCDKCDAGDHSAKYLTDIHDPLNPTWWQSETMFEGIQSPNQVNLTLHLGKSFDITYIRLVFYSPRPESFAIYKRVTENGPWLPYQYYSATCRDTYSLPDTIAIKQGEDEQRALCTSEYSDISPLRDGNIAFATLEGRPSAYNFDHSPELQHWVTATDILISLDRLNTFGDEVFGDAAVLKSYFYAIADIAVGARCKCNGHASKCVQSTGLNGERTRVCECKHFTDGPDCEKCLPFYNDVPWGRATTKNVHECKPCNCNGFSQKCYFDRALYNLTGHGGHCIDCAANRDGANCERCKENFYMRDDGYCISCGCDPIGSRSLQCNSEGKCQCKPGVTGEKCDRCEANYYNFGPHGCQACNCDARGSLDNTPSCHPDSGICFCKENVEGRHCRECKPGFFNLDLDNKFGCTPCFCYGHTSECQSAPGYSIVSTTSNFNKHQEKWLAVDRSGYPVDLKYNRYSQNIGVSAHGNNFIYFLAPERFLGDQRASYNRLLKFRLQLVGQQRPDTSPYDVVLEGAGTKISLPIFSQDNKLPDQQIREYAFRLHENSEYSWQPSQSARGFMQILSNLTAIKIRATYSNEGEGFIDEVELQTAHRGAAGRPASWIEQCTCPEGYLGQFCESCAPGYRHSPALGGPFMPCIPCDCNKHADICDSETGRCICQHNTAGDNCGQCAKGYYGNALGGTPFDCKRCPCPDNGACLEMPGGDVICLECPLGYVGSRCELCSDGYYGDPTGASGKVQVCQQCDCNGNVDLNAVGNCNRTTGECLKCIHNTAGPHCGQCLPGHFGDPFASPHGKCDQCNCYRRGTEQTDDGVDICDQLSGNCHCKPNIIGRDCNECKNGFWNIGSGNGCESCNCDLVGSYNSSCDIFTGQCYCKPGVTGAKCDQCQAYQYGFSLDGCKQCDCDAIGSKGRQCDQNGQCPCNDNVEGLRCDRCKENTYDREKGCIDCPDCYNLVQDAVDEHRTKLEALKRTLQDIANNPTVSDDIEFESKLKATQEKLEILLDDAKSAAGGGDLTLVERVNELHDKLSTIRDLLDNADQLQDTASGETDKANAIAVQLEKTILLANKELTSALDVLQTDGHQALQRAKERSTSLDNQSKEISEISRQARKYADKLENDADTAKAIAQEALDKATKAFEVAKSTNNLQQQINADIKQNISTELSQLTQKLETVKRITEDSLEKANEVYDEALTLFANINSLSAPEINTKQIKEDAKRLIEESDRILKELDKIVDSHDDLLKEVAENIELAKVLIERCEQQKHDAIMQLNDVTISHTKALEAVDRGSKTLKEANETFHILAEFQNKIKQSSENARVALETVGEIDKQISDAEELVDTAENALDGAKNNANDARKNAQEAQEKYAEQASKDAENIRQKANETKVGARLLRTEADNLNLRVASTEIRMSNLENASKKDDELTKEAKDKVGQANADAAEAQKQVEKALREVNAITEELASLRNINTEDLNRLEQQLEMAENELRSANLDERLATLTELKNNQITMIKSYQHEIKSLGEEVANVRLIAESLPEGCFKRVRLEP